MTNYRTIRLVKGYHEVTPVPPLASEGHLSNRFAVVLDTYRPERGYMYFDVELFLAIFRGMSSVIDHDAFAAEIDTDTRCGSLGDLHEKLLKTCEDDREPPRRAYFRKHGQLTCLEETEFWNLCGGPAPYHDSYTFSFFTKDDLADSFEAACSAACRDVSGVVEEIIEASRVPVRTPWWKRLLRAMR